MSDALGPQPWSVEPAGTLTAGPRLEGIGWSFVPSYGGVPTSDQEEQAPTTSPAS